MRTRSSAGVAEQYVEDPDIYRQTQDETSSPKADNRPLDGEIS